MQIDKQQIIDMLKSRGDHDQAAQAEQNLPDQVDTDEHADQLGILGVSTERDLTGGLKDKFNL